MAQEGIVVGATAGPGNKLIATTLLELLAVRGRTAAVQRATRALDQGEAGLAQTSAWLPANAIDQMFHAADVDANLARSVGHRLTEPDATGLRLYGLGLATPEKAYRRIQSLLPREEADATWTIDSISEGYAEITFEGALADAPARTASARCALRRGQLEAIPGLFGLLPGHVDESSCLGKGDSACCYSVRWERSPQTGLMLGGAIGLGLCAGIASAIFMLGTPLVPGMLSATLSLVVGASAGRVYDLHRQLEAVAGARRGHLALFDQVDDALASKLDALARADAKLVGQNTPQRNAAQSAAPSESNARRGPDAETLAAAHEIHAAAGDLECWFEEQGERAASEAEGAGADWIADERGRVREIREWAARIADRAGQDSLSGARATELRALVARAVACARPSLGARAQVEIDAEPELRSIHCEPVQVEELVIQLLRNAVEASVSISDAPEVLVSLRNRADGIELSVEDRGVGIESSAVDEVFDPFFGDRPIGVGGGMGLPLCLRIVERHGGELRIESEDRAGTRVCVFLPEKMPTGEKEC
ncbi:MAG: sensor histidine kinase [Myxococcota bacterium]